MRGSNYTMVSLFSGAGGMDLGFNSKFHILLANDIRKAVAPTYHLNFQHPIVELGKCRLKDIALPAFLLGDVSEVDFEAVKHNDIDLVIGGPPCQDFSIVRGKEQERQGIRINRGRLYAHFVRALIHLQPKVFVFENVPGLKSANKGVAFRTILEDFSKLIIRGGDIGKLIGNNTSRSLKNYLIAFSDVVDSANLGVPQKRKRLIIIGIREDLLRNLGIFSRVKLAAEKILHGSGSLFRKYPLTALEAFEGRPLNELYDEYRQIMRDYQNIADEVKTPVAVNWEKNVWSALTFDCIKDYLRACSAVPESERELDCAFEEHAQVLRHCGYYGKRLEGAVFADGSNELAEESEAVMERLKRIPPGENHEFVRGTKWEVEGKGMSLIYRRLHPLKPSYTVVAFGGGGTWGYHFRRDRGRLTNRERARLQTFPDSFRFSGSGEDVRAQIGEAVPPLLGEKIAEVVEMILRQ